MRPAPYETIMKIAVAAAALSLASGCVARGSQPSPSPSFVRIGETVRVDGVAVRALALVEDSRCPMNVVCIQAGTVRLAVRIDKSGRSREAVLQLGQPEQIGTDRSIRLVAVCPARRDPEPPPAAAYRFLIGTAEGDERVDCDAA